MTAGVPERHIPFEGCTNFRDLGGWDRRPDSCRWRLHRRPLAWRRRTCEVRAIRSDFAAVSISSCWSANSSQEGAFLQGTGLRAGVGRLRPHATWQGAISYHAPPETRS
jgi:hypothetical protein